MADRTEFNVKKEYNPKFEPTIKTPAKNVSSPTSKNFGGNALDKVITKPKIKKKKKTVFPNEVEETKKKKRGRPVEVKDPLQKVDRPKMISTTLEIKLSVLQDFVTEFQEETGRITFDKYINTLVDAYVKSNMTYSKQEAFKRELDYKINEKRK